MILANVAIPTVVPHMFAAAILLPVVAASEAIVIRKYFLNDYSSAFRLSLGANWRSTLVGLPMGYAYAFMGLIPAGIFSTLLPDGSQELFFMVIFHSVLQGGTMPNALIPLAMAAGLVFILIPYFYASVFVEKKYLIKHISETEQSKIKPVVWKMNLLTYACLMVYAFINLLEIINQHSTSI
jgi:hypothetical protein